MRFGLYWLLLSASLASAAADPAKLIFDHAAQALAAGDYRTAERGFETVLREQPSNIAALADLGIVYSRTNRAAQALASYKHALALSPADEAILLNTGLLYFKQDLHAQALPYFARVVALDPTHRQARSLLAVCRLYAGQVTQAIHDLEDLRAAAPSDEQILFLLAFAHLKNGDTETAQSIFNEMFSVAGPLRAQFLLGRASYEAALFPQAEESFLAVQKQQPDYPGLPLALGKLYISQRRDEDALRELQLALHDPTTREEANYFLGGLLVQQGRYADALPYLEEADRLKPDSWATYFYLGKANLRLQKSAQAVVLLKKAVALNPDEPSAQYQLARALQSSGETLAAERAFRRAKELHAGALADTKIPGVR